MKIGKKFLSLLMGVAVLLVSSLPTFAAEVETTDCASVSYAMLPNLMMVAKTMFISSTASRTIISFPLMISTP